MSWHGPEAQISSGYPGRIHSSNQVLPVTKLDHYFGNLRLWKIRLSANSQPHPLAATFPHKLFLCLKQWWCGTLQSVHQLESARDVSGTEKGPVWLFTRSLTRLTKVMFLVRAWSIWASTSHWNQPWYNTWAPCSVVKDGWYRARRNQHGYARSALRVSLPRTLDKRIGK